MPNNILPLLQGRTLLIGPSRSGKSYFANAFKQAGLPVIDADHDTNLLQWYNDASGEIVHKPIRTDSVWLANNHYIVSVKELEQFLADKPNLLLFAHCWNIWDTIGLFDHAVYMYIPPEEVERRLLVERPDHEKGIGSNTELAFFRKRHVKRSEEAKKLKIPFIDATLSPQDFYKQLQHVCKQAKQ